MAPDLLEPAWPAPDSVRAACSTRSGGVSAAPYDSLNLGDHVGDDPAAVAANRQRFAQALGARPVFMKQVHGSGVARLTLATPDGIEADACWTTEGGVACTIMVADCLPVLLADRRGRVVGAAHCGWRGLAGERGQGVLEALWRQMLPQLGSDRWQAAQGMVAWLGPCIGPDAFEVGPEVREAFLQRDPEASACFRAHGNGKFMAHLPALARRRLQALGIASIHGNDGTPGWCTVSAASRFFSHRRDRVSGRLAAAAWLA
ncbi:MAG: peptidoglycan editing factor PgeF [Ramlibacter sp.]